MRQIAFPLCAAVALCLGATVSAGSKAQADTTKSSRVHPVSAKLQSKYADLQARLISQGRLRTDRGPMTTAGLDRDFLEIAMKSEYGGGLSGEGTRAGKPLLRWEEPVRLQVIFGASVDTAQKKQDLRSIRDYAGQLARASGHPVQMSPQNANFYVLVVNEGERQGLARQLPKLIPGISDSVVKTVARMQPNHLCMVVADPHRDHTRGYRMAVAIVRAEHSGTMRRSCIQEELAQGMGLPNDCPTAMASIFNDDEEFAVLTRRDEALLRLLYSDDLRSGMSVAEVQPRLEQLVRRLPN